MKQTRGFSGPFIVAAALGLLLSAAPFAQRRVPAAEPPFSEVLRQLESEDRPLTRGVAGATRATKPLPRPAPKLELAGRRLTALRDGIYLSERAGLEANQAAALLEGRQNPTDVTLITVLSQRDTTAAAQKLPPSSRIVLTRFSDADLMAALARNRGKQVFLLGHLENSTLVVRDMKGDIIYHVGVERIEEMADSLDVNLFMLGCNSACISDRAGVVGEFNTLDVVRRFEQARFARTYGDFLQRLTVAGPGMPQILITVDRQMLEHGRRQVRARIVDPKHPDQTLGEIRISLRPGLSSGAGGADSRETSDTIDYGVAGEELEREIRTRIATRSFVITDPSHPPVSAYCEPPPATDAPANTSRDIFQLTPTRRRAGERYLANNGDINRQDTEYFLHCSEAQQEHIVKVWTQQGFSQNIATVNLAEANAREWARGAILAEWMTAQEEYARYLEEQAARRWRLRYVILPIALLCMGGVAASRVLAIYRRVRRD